MRLGLIRPIFGVLGGAIAIAGCVLDSGQTGSPFSDPPNYQGPGRFQPPADGSGGGNSAPDEGNRHENQSLGELMHLYDDYLIVAGIDALHVIDVSAEEPRSVGEVPLRGRFRTILIWQNFAVIAVEESAAVEATQIPEEPAVAYQTRLVLVDLSNPEEPRRVSSVDLDGAVWRLHQEGDALLVLSELTQAPALTCGVSIGWPWGPTTDKLVVQAFALAGDELALQSTAELPANVPFGFVSESAYFGVQADSEGNARSLYATTYASGAFGEPVSLTIQALPEDVARQGDTVVVVEPSGSVSFSSLAGGQETRARLSGVGATSAKFIGEGLVALSSPEGTTLVDVSNVDSPVVRQELGREVAELEVTSFGVLSLGASSSGHLVLQLWDLSDTGNLQLKDRIETSLPYAQHRGGRRAWRYESARGRLLVPVNAWSENGVQSSWSTFSVSEDGLALLGTQELVKSAARMLSSDSQLLAILGDELFYSAVPSAADSNPEVRIERLRPQKPIDRLTVGSSELALYEREEDGRFVLRRTAPQGEEAELELDHWADALVERDGRIVVVGLRGFAEECEYAEQAGLPPEEVPRGPSGVDNCAPHRARGITVVSAGNTLTQEATFRVTSQLDALDDFSQDASWAGYFPLPNQRLGFAVRHTARCDSKAECERLGVKAYRSYSTPGCSPQTEDCDSLPTTVESWSGHRSTLRIYVLDDIAGAPKLKLSAETLGRHELGGDLDLSFRVLQHEQGIGFSREEPIYNEEGNSISNADGETLVRFFLDRFAFGDEGQPVVALESINTPGLPLAWAGDEVFSVEPRYLDEKTTAATLHRSLIRNGGAFIRESKAIDRSFQEARQYESYVYVTWGPQRWCEEPFEGFLQPLRARAGELELGTTLTVRNGVGFAPLRSPFLGDQLFLSGGTVPGGRLVVDISNRMQPKLSRYTTALD